MLPSAYAQWLATLTPAEAALYAERRTAMAELTAARARQRQAVAMATEREGRVGLGGPSRFGAAEAAAEARAERDSLVAPGGRRMLDELRAARERRAEAEAKARAELESRLGPDFLHRWAEVRARVAAERARRAEEMARHLDAVTIRVCPRSLRPHWA